MTKKLQQYGIDSTFLIAFSVLVIGGLVILQTASSVASFNETGNHYHYFTNQLVRGVLPGVILFMTLSSIPYQVWKKLSLLIIGGALVVNALVLVPGIGLELKGASRWLDLGPIAFQPSELLKLALILYLAMILSKLGPKINTWGALVSVLVVLSLTVGIVAVIQSDLSTALVLLVIAASMLFQSQIGLSKILILALVGVIAGIGFIAMEPYRLARVQTFVQGGEENSLGQGYHVQQNLIAVGSGGVSGVGWNQSRQKFNYVPETTADSVFAIFAEESGLVGIVLLTILYLVISVRLIQISGRLPDSYGQFIIIGVVTWFVFQSFLNIGSTMKLIPLTGMTLPFISYGSSSLWVLFAGFGIVANVTKYRKE